jgi:hypothetical protein
MCAPQLGNRERDWGKFYPGDRLMPDPEGWIHFSMETGRARI